MNKEPHLVWAALSLALLMASPALAGGGGSESVNVVLDLEVTYHADGDVGRFSNRDLPASDLKICAFTERNLFGSPKVLASGVTDLRGRVRLRFVAKANARIDVQAITETDLSLVFPGAMNIFTTPHRKDLRLVKVADLQAGRYAGKLHFASGVFSRAVHVQHVGAGMQRFARETFGRVKSIRRFSYSFPGWLSGGKSYAPGAQRAVILDRAHMRSSETIAHETCHMIWYQLRDRVEYYWPLAHEWGKKAGNPALALSEGWAYAQAIPALNVIARRAGTSSRDNVYGAGERHLFHASRRSADWGFDGEVNVISGLYDLWDVEADALGVVDGKTDTANGGDLPSGAAAQVIIAQAIRYNGTQRRRIDLGQLWEDTLRAVFGARGAETLQLNGLPVEDLSAERAPRVQRAVPPGPGVGAQGFDSWAG